MSTKAKQHSVLQGLSAQLKGVRASDTFEVLGHKFKLGLLTPADKDWVSEKVTSAKGIIDYASRSQRPRVAAALMEIDSLPISQLFTLPDDVSKEDRERLEKEPLAMALWRREQVYDYLGSEDCDDDLIRALDEKYGLLEDRKRAKLEDISNLSRGMPSKV